MRLKEARERRGWTQEYVAEQLGVNTVTISRWECGKSMPRGYQIPGICELFEASAEALGLDKTVRERSHRALLFLPQTPIFNDLDQDPVVRLTSLAHLSLCSYNTAHHRLALACEEFMNDPTRRNVLRGILSALATLPLGEIRQSWQWEPILAQCNVAIAACQELSISGDAADLKLAFSNVSAYLDVVKTIAHDASHLHKDALNLAAHCAILRTELGWSHNDPVKVVQYAQEAVVYSNEYYEETGDISILLSARSKLAWAYNGLYNTRNKLALETALASQSLLDHTDREIHPCLRGGTQSTLAIMQASQGLDADAALGEAMDLDPGDKPVALMDFTRARQPLEKARVLCHQDKPEQARETLEEQIDPKTLIQKQPGSGWGSLEGIYLLTLSSLKSKGRQMDEIIHFWTAGVQGAKDIRSEFRFAKSANLYQQMRLVWPGEQRILDLREHLVHW